MADTKDNDLIRALQRAAEGLLARSITASERNKLVEIFNGTSGTNRERALAALSRFAGISQRGIVERTAASDNTDRLVDELASAIGQWGKG